MFFDETHLTPEGFPVGVFRHDVIGQLLLERKSFRTIRAPQPGTSGPVNRDTVIVKRPGTAEKLVRFGTLSSVFLLNETR